MEVGNVIPQNHLREHKTLSGINITICKSSKEIKKSMFKFDSLRFIVITQLTFTCSNSTMGAPEQCVKSVQS